MPAQPTAEAMPRRNHRSAESRVRLGDLLSVDTGPPGRRHEWCLEGPDGATALVPHDPRLVTEDMVALRFAALEGVGIAQLPATVVRPDLLQGRLAEVMPRWVPRRKMVHALSPSRRGLLPAIRHLLDFLAEQFAALCRSEQGYERDAELMLRRNVSDAPTQAARAASVPNDLAPQS